MNTKFLRNYLLEVQRRPEYGDTYVQVRTPFTVEFDIKRDRASSLNTYNIRVYNLNEQRRNSILKDYWERSKEQFGRVCRLYAGYGGYKDIYGTDNSLTADEARVAYPLISTGNIMECSSQREGTDYVTEISGMDGGNALLNAKFNDKFVVGTPIRTVIFNIMRSMTAFGVKPGSIGTFADVLTRDTSFSGNPMDLINEITDGNAFIDGGRIHAIKDDESVETDRNNIVSALINSDTGLLGTPRRQQQMYSFETLFNPEIIPGTQVRIESNVTNSKFYNGYAIVWSVHHKGMISSAVAGSATTTFEVRMSSSGLSQIPIAGNSL